tara:strand:- start:227 stop:475 length:249 start_codon:yes stop_codon:yes gene_type:complete
MVTLADSHVTGPLQRLTPPLAEVDIWRDAEAAAGRSAESAPGARGATRLTRDDSPAAGMESRRERSIVRGAPVDVQAFSVIA